MFLYAYPVNYYIYVQNLIFSLKNWSTNFSFFLKGKVFSSFSLFHFKRLKNIFLKTVYDFDFWFEIENMIKVGLIDLSFNFLSINLNNFSYTYLSLLLFNVYFLEFDIYLYNLSFCLIRLFSLV